MVYLVTGGAGFIGSNYLEYMVPKYKNDLFICLDKLTYAANINNLNKIKNSKNFIFIKEDICNKLDYIFNKYNIDIIINFAAESHVTKSISEPKIFLDTNIYGTFNLLEYTKKYNIKRFHQISTDEVYGSANDIKFNEEDKLNPSTPYAASKASADLLVMTYFKTYNLPVTISRCTNNYGKYQNKEKLIPLVINNIKNNKKIPIFGDGLHIRDFIHVLDHVRGIELILNKGKIGNIYNICGNNLYTTLDIINIIKNTLNLNVEYEYLTDRLGNDKKYYIDDTKIKELGFKNKYKFNKEFKNIIKWYFDN